MRKSIATALILESVFAAASFAQAATSNDVKHFWFSQQMQQDTIRSAEDDERNISGRPFTPVALIEGEPRAFTYSASSLKASPVNFKDAVYVGAAAGNDGQILVSDSGITAEGKAYAKAHNLRENASTLEKIAARNETAIADARSTGDDISSDATGDILTFSQVLPVYNGSSAPTGAVEKPIRISVNNIAGVYNSKSALAGAEIRTPQGYTILVKETPKAVSDAQSQARLTHSPYYQ